MAGQHDRREQAETLGSPQSRSFLFVSQYFPPERGAAQVRLGAVTRELSKQGHLVEVVTAIPNYPTGSLFPGWKRRLVQAEEADGIRVVRVWVWAAIGSGLNRVANYLSFGALSILGLSRTGRADWTVVEYPTLAGALPAVLWCRAIGRPVIVNVADLWVDAAVAVGAIPEGRGARLARRVERWMFGRADLVNAVTEGVRDALIEKGVNPDRICWLPNGADTDLFTPEHSISAAHQRDVVRAELGAREGESIVLYAGTHGYVHGLDVVLDAAHLLRGDAVRFVLVGGGSEKHALQRRAKAESLDNVTFLDPVPPERIATYLGESAAGLATVRPGDLYRSIRSAKMLPVMSSGVPIVYSGDDEGAAIVVREGAGLVSPPGDGAALAKAISSVLESPGRAAEMGAAGRAWVLREASWATIAEHWVAEVEAKRPAGGRPLNLGFIGVHSGGRSGQPPSQDETLASLFASAGAVVLTASKVRNPLVRTAHQAVSVLRWPRDLDVVMISVFSGRSFVYADLTSALCSLTKRRTVMVLHGGRLPEFASRHSRWVHRVLRRADLLVSPSAFQARAFRTHGLAVTCVPNVVPLNSGYAHRAQARPRLLWMRTFHDDYDPCLAVEVLDLVRRSHGDVRLTMAGADHGLLAEVEATIDRLGLADAVDIVGFLDQHGKQLAFEEHDIFLNTNRVDNTPVSVLEAAGAGLVPVSTAAGGIPDLLTDGVDSLVVPVGDASALATAVGSLLDDSDLFAALGRGARALAEHCDWPAVHDEWIAELTTLTGRAGP